MSECSHTAHARLSSRTRPPPAVVTRVRSHSAGGERGRTRAVSRARGFAHIAVESPSATAQCGTLSHKPHSLGTGTNLPRTHPSKPEFPPSLPRRCVPRPSSRPSSGLWRHSAGTCMLRASLLFAASSAGAPTKPHRDQLRDITHLAAATIVWRQRYRQQMQPSVWALSAARISCNLLLSHLPCHSASCLGLAISSRLPSPPLFTTLYPLPGCDAELLSTTCFCARHAKACAEGMSVGAKASASWWRDQREGRWLQCAHDLIA